MTREDLLALARESALRAHCPYSHFRVGTALVAGGKLYTGVNIEISSYGLTLCAERSALAAAISDGAGPITQVALACIDTPPAAPLHERTPCGACRQLLAEFGLELEVSAVGPSTQKRWTLAALLPDAFTRETLDR